VARPQRGLHPTPMLASCHPRRPARARRHRCPTCSRLPFRLSVLSLLRRARAAACRAAPPAARWQVVNVLAERATGSLKSNE
jgi:hypothetical protein